MAKDTSLVLRVCRADMTSYGGFVWPSEVGAMVEASDGKKNKECGNGLHGWLYGQGELCVDYWSLEGCKWLVLEVESKSIVMIGGKCKFPKAVVRFVGNRLDAVEYLLANEPRSKDVAVIGRIAECGDSQSLLAGALSTLTGGDGSELRIQYYDKKTDRSRTKIAYVGEHGIKPNTKYRLNDKNEFEAVE